MSMIRKYHNNKLQTNPWHREEEPHNNHKTPGRQTKQSNQISLPHQDDSKTRMVLKYISVLHARLRNKCSNLNNDLFINHIRDNPLCDLCGVVEDAIHYFFHCRRYTIESQVSMIQTEYSNP